MNTWYTTCIEWEHICLNKRVTCVTMIDYESFDHYLSGSYEYIFQHINTQTAQNMCYHMDCIKSSDVSVARLVCQASGQSWWWHTRLLRPCHPSPKKLVKTSKSMPWHLQIHSKSLWINLFAKELNGHQKLHLAKHKRKVQSSST